jgi:hypothetical protein
MDFSGHLLLVGFLMNAAVRGLPCSKCGMCSATRVWTSYMLMLASRYVPGSGKAKVFCDQALCSLIASHNARNRRSSFSWSISPAPQCWPKIGLIIGVLHDMEVVMKQAIGSILRAAGLEITRARENPHELPHQPEWVSRIIGRVMPSLNGSLRCASPLPIFTDTRCPVIL